MYCLLTVLYFLLFSCSFLTFPLSLFFPFSFSSFYLLFSFSLSIFFPLSCAEKQTATLTRRQPYNYLFPLEYIWLSRRHGVYCRWAFVSSHKSSRRRSHAANFVPFEFIWDVFFLPSQPCYDERSRFCFWFSPAPINVVHAGERRQSDSKLGFDNLCKTAPLKEWILGGDEAGGEQRGERKMRARNEEKTKKKVKIKSVISNSCWMLCLNSGNTHTLGAFSTHTHTHKVNVHILLTMHKIYI